MIKIIYNRLKFLGGMPEWFIGAVLKTVVRLNVPWVRIPPPPNLKVSPLVGLLNYIDAGLEATQPEWMSVGENATTFEARTYSSRKMTDAAS